MKKELVKKSFLASFLFLFLIMVSFDVFGEIADHVVISEVQTGKTGAATDEFVELYNPTNSDINLNGWRLTKKTSSGTKSNLLTTFPNEIIPSHGFFLVTHKTGYTGDVTSDANYSTSSSIANSNNAVLLYSDAGVTLVDKVGYGTADNETLPTPNPPADQSIERKSSLTHNEDQGNGWDTNNNSADFISRTTPQPQNSTNGTEIPDNLAPIIYLTSPENNTFFNTKNINFTFSFTDNTDSNNCSIYLDNILNQTNETTLNFTTTAFEVLNINENANIKWNITCVDNSLNENTSLRVFTIDVTYPEISKITEQVTTTTATINWNTNENTNSSIYYGTNLNLTSNTTNSSLDAEHEFQLQSLESNTLYYYNISSCDQVNNCNNSGTYNFTTSAVTTSTPTTTSGGGHSGSRVNTFNIDVTLKKTLTVKEKDVIDFSLKESKHKIKVNEVKTNSVVLVISSEPITIEVKVGETKEIDLDEDNKADVKITLVKIFYDGKIKIIFEEIKQEVIKEIEEQKEKIFFHYNKSKQVNETDLITGGAVTSLYGEINLISILITLIIIVAGVIIYLDIKEKFI